MCSTPGFILRAAQCLPRATGCYVHSPALEEDVFIDSEESESTGPSSLNLQDDNSLVDSSLVGSFSTPPFSTFQDGKRII